MTWKAGIKKLLLVLELSGLKYCMRGTRVWWTQVPIYIGPLPTLKLSEHSCYPHSHSAYSFNFLNPYYPHSHSLLSHHSLSQSPSHSLNLAINSLSLSQSHYQTLPHTLNLPFSLILALILSLPFALGLPLALLLTLSVSFSLCIFSLESQGMSRSVCIFNLSIGYLWVFVGFFVKVFAIKVSVLLFVAVEIFCCLFLFLFCCGYMDFFPLH